MPPCWRWCALGGAGADAVVPRPGLALGRRADRGAGLQLRGVDGLAHPAHRPGAEPRLSADRAASASTARWRAARSSTASPPASSRPCIVLGRDQVALLAIYLLAALRPLAHPVGAGAARRAARAACCRSGPVRSARCSLIAVPVLLTAMLAQESNRPSIDYVGAARGSLHPALLLTLVMPDVFGASGRMEDYWGPPSFAWPDTGLFIAQNMGELYIGAIPLLLLADGRRARPAVGAGDPLLHLRRGRRAALCARLVHAGVPRASTRCCPASASTAGRRMRRS